MVDGSLFKKHKKYIRKFIFPIPVRSFSLLNLLKIVLLIASSESQSAVQIFQGLGIKLSKNETQSLKRYMF